MSVEARPVVVRPHPTVEPGQTEGPSRLLADEGDQLPRRPDDLDEEQPDDIGLRADAEEEGEHVVEMTEYDLEAIDAGGAEAEVEDTPGDDATIAAARIERFDEAHRGVAPVDAGPFEERRRDHDQ